MPFLSSSLSPCHGWPRQPSKLCWALKLWPICRPMRRRTRSCGRTSFWPCACWVSSWLHPRAPSWSRWPAASYCPRPSSLRTSKVRLELILKRSLGSLRIELTLYRPCSLILRLASQPPSVPARHQYYRRGGGARGPLRPGHATEHHFEYADQLKRGHEHYKVNAGGTFSFTRTTLIIIINTLKKGWLLRWYYMPQGYSCKLGSLCRWVRIGWLKVL